MVTPELLNLRPSAVLTVSSLKRKTSLIVAKQESLLSLKNGSMDNRQDSVLVSIQMALVSVKLSVKLSVNLMIREAEASLSSQKIIVLRGHLANK